jgi:hypothetical protein
MVTAVLAGFVAFVAIQAAGAGAAAAKATLRVTRLNPLTIRATGFKAGERVVVTLTAGTSKKTGQATAGATGAVTVTISGAGLTRCTAYSLRASGSKGGVATFKATVAPTCKPDATVTFGSTVAVIGKHFRPHERLTVKFVADEARTKIATATGVGSFVAGFGALPLSECSGYTLNIVGSLGSRFTKTKQTVPC